MMEFRLEARTKVIVVGATLELDSDQVEALAKARLALESVMVHAEHEVPHQIEPLVPVVALLEGVADLYNGNGSAPAVAVEPIKAEVLAAAGDRGRTPPAPEPLSPEPEGAPPVVEEEDDDGDEPGPFSDLTVADLNGDKFGKEHLKDREWLEAMHHTLGLSLGDIAKLTGVANNTAKSYILKAGLEYCSHRGKRSQLPES